MLDTESPNTEVPKVWYRSEDAATYLGFSRSMLAKMRIYGDGPTYSKLGRMVVYEVADLDAWAKGRKRKSTSEPERF